MARIYATVLLIEHCCFQKGFRSARRKHAVILMDPPYITQLYPNRKLSDHSRLTYEKIDQVADVVEDVLVCGGLTSYCHILFLCSTLTVIRKGGDN